MFNPLLRIGVIKSQTYRSWQIILKIKRFYNAFLRPSAYWLRTLSPQRAARRVSGWRSSLGRGGRTSPTTSGRCAPRCVCRTRASASTRAGRRAAPASPSTCTRTSTSWAPPTGTCCAASSGPASACSTPARTVRPHVVPPPLTAAYDEMQNRNSKPYPKT